MFRMVWRSSTGLLTAVVSLALVAGCSGGPGGGEPSDPSQAPTAGGSTAPSQAPAPEPISLKEYNAALTKALDPLGSALDGLADAKRYKSAKNRVSDVGSAADKAATGLGQIIPPTEVAQENEQLVTALGAFSKELGGLSSAVADRALCTGSTVRASLGNEKATPALRKALAAVSDKVPGNQPSLKLPAADQKSGDRPANGDFIRSEDRTGRGELTIKNGGSNDAVVSLAKKGKPLISVYVRKGKTAKVNGIPDNTYAFLFTGGSSWDRDARAFGRKCTFQKFADLAKYRTTQSGGRILYQTYTISLNVAFGNARTEDVDPDDFPDS